MFAHFCYKLDLNIDCKIVPDYLFFLRLMLGMKNKKICEIRMNR